MTFTQLSFNPEDTFDHNIPFMFVFPHKISGEFCTLLHGSENMTDGVLEKKANETQKILIKIKHSSFSFFFFLPKSACLCCFFQLVVLEQLLQCLLAAGFICTAALCPSHNFILTVS